MDIQTVLNLTISDTGELPVYADHRQMDSPDFEFESSQLASAVLNERQALE